MTCKIDHGGPGELPGFLCRTCHPELTAPQSGPSSAVQVKRHELAKLERQLVHERITLDNMVATYGNAAATAIEKQRAKVARLASRVAKQSGKSDGAGHT